MFEAGFGTHRMDRAIDLLAETTGKRAEPTVTGKSGRFSSLSTRTSSGVTDAYQEQYLILLFKGCDTSVFSLALCDECSDLLGPLFVLLRQFLHLVEQQRGEHIVAHTPESAVRPAGHELWVHPFDFFRNQPVLHCAGRAPA
jgi:hypothetical protein